MFVHFKNIILNSDQVEWIDYVNLSSNGYIRLYDKSGLAHIIEGPQAFDVVMRLCPEATEGRAFKCQRRRWAIHNLFGHPLLQIFAWLGLTELGLKIHDKTVPNPITK